MQRYKSPKDLPKEDLWEGGHPLCSGCPASLGLRNALKVLGKNTVVINASGCLTLAAVYPYTPLKVPWIHSAIENAGSTALGIWSAYKRLGKKVNILCYAGDGATYDIGFQSLSHAIEKGCDFIYICYNNQCFANTGVQESTATPYGAFTNTSPPGKKNRIGSVIDRKPLAKIIAAHEIPYVATASCGFQIDFMNKVKKASEVRGPAFIDYFSTCQPGWGVDPSKTLEVGRLAVETGAWPLFEIENGEFRLTYTREELKPLKEYLKYQRRFAHLRDKDIKEIEERIRREWEELKKGNFWTAHYV